ncbi:type I-U CRISPR-associated protein Csb2 [Thioalkalivibrio sp. ALJT]|uniref:type I-G CRISPR-associated protein Csb2 n=1 Tax=Thioalkalivibrio sp. ALJT TaxID=1158146 RepID=UPI000475CAD6|nr:type I-U CRISPR-associated protein Csb2 [Thioalkalivibrio sp. ALJT]
MAESALLLKVRLPGQRYHGLPEWPPSPFRLYQALVAGALVGEPDGRADELASLFDWLAELPPPWIAVPPSRRGGAVDMFMPNNDLDTKGGDPRKVPEIRGAQKHVQPRFFEAEAPVSYLWNLPLGERERGQEIAAVAERLYQLGRGIDMAYAETELTTPEDAETQLMENGLILYRPCGENRERGVSLRAPAPGSFESLQKRFAAQRERLIGGHLTQAPPPRFRTVTYNAKPVRLLFDLISSSEKGSGFHPIPQRRATWLTGQVRDRLAHLLGHAFGKELVGRIIIGRGATAEDKAKRVMITPLPSIGSEFADHALRRVMLTIPPNCPIPAREVEWAAGAIHLGVTEEGEIVDENQPQLVRASETGMLDHYGVGENGGGFRTWRTVTPMVLPLKRPKGRVSAAERADHESRVAGTVLNSLRHAGVRTPVETIHVQREPFDKKGMCVNGYEAPERFEPRRRYHVEITFAEPCTGPLLIGDGRFMGLGLFAPDRRRSRDTFAFKLPPKAQVSVGNHRSLLSSVRRALMARARDEGQRGRSIPRLFSGHEQDGRPASAGGRHNHIFLAADDTDGDGLVDRIYVFAPWACDRSTPIRYSDLVFFDRVVSSLEWINMRHLGRLHLERESTLDPEDHLLRAARKWETVTPYWSTRHLKPGKERAAIERDVQMECQRRGLPIPAIRVRDYHHGPNGGQPKAWLQLEFAQAIAGPLLLGRGSHGGNGLFKPAH